MNTPVGSGDPWMEAMKRGDWSAAWEFADRVLAERRGKLCWHRPRHEQYVWNGDPLDGKRVLIRCYHGLGDTLQFIRFAPLVKRVAAEVIVWAQPALLPLLRTTAGVDRWMPLHDGTPEVDYDVDVELMELPHVFRTTLDALPREVPYVHAPPRRMPRAGTGMNVGIVWAAGDWDARRNVPICEFARLAQTHGVTLHALQRGDALSEWPAEWGPVSGADRVEDLAGIMRALDLVITIDSMPAHLAGALGVPVWTLLHSDADWRWMRDRDDSPWYPTMRLFRQRSPDRWAEVLEQVARALQQPIVRPEWMAERCAG